MTATRKAALISIQERAGEWDEQPGTILITDDGNSGRVYLGIGETSMAVDLGDLIDAIKIQLCGASP